MKTKIVEQSLDNSQEILENAYLVETPTHVLLMPEFKPEIENEIDYEKLLDFIEKELDGKDIHQFLKSTNESPEETVNRLKEERKRLEKRHKQLTETITEYERMYSGHA